MSSIIFNHTTLKGIRYKLVDGFPTFNTTREHVSAAERYIIDGNNLEAFYRESFPPPEFRRIQSESHLVPSWYKPIIYPPRAMPGAANLRTKSVKFSPVDEGMPGDPLNSDTVITGAAWFATYADYYYADIEYEIYNDTYDHRMTTGGQFLSTPATGTRLSDIDVSGTFTQGTSVPNNNIQMAMLKVRPTIEHSLLWPLILNPRFEEMRKRLGMVNSTVTKFLHDAPKQTCLFMGYSGRQVRLWDTVQKEKLEPWSIELHFSQLQTTEEEQVYGWNHYWDSENQKWAYLTTERDDRPTYQGYDFEHALRNWPGIEDQRTRFS